MSMKSTLQDMLLGKLQRERQVVTVFITNGFRTSGRITGFDQHTIVLEIRGEQQIISKHAVSTITPSQPVDLDNLREEAR